MLDHLRDWLGHRGRLMRETSLALLPSFVRARIAEARRRAAKDYWRSKSHQSLNSALLYEAIDVDKSHLHRILEFGCHGGDNLAYFLERHACLQAVGVDINPVVRQLAGREPRLTAIVGDERVLGTFATGEFCLAFTVSVLDHIPSKPVVLEAIRELVRVAQTVYLLEPFIEGIDGDVSGKTRNQVRPGLERGYKRFALHSYLWDYDGMLNGLQLNWTKYHLPLHTASLGPFYHLYKITSGRPTLS